MNVDLPVTQGYMAKIDETDLRSIVPAKLHQDPSVLFTNIAEIHEFHSGQVACCSTAAVFCVI